MSSTQAALSFRSLLFLCALSAVSFFAGLGRRDLWGADEMRYATTVREMAENGDWIAPKFNRHDDGEKPPLFYWAGAATAKIRGGADELSTLLPSAFGGFLMLLFSYLLGWIFLGRLGAFFTALMLATTLGLFWQGRNGQIDAFFGGLVTGSIYFFLSGRRREGAARRWRLFWAYLFAGLAWLAKGPVVVPLLAIPVVLDLVLLGGGRGVRALLAQLGGLGLWWGVPWFLLIVVPWYVALGLHQPNGWGLVQKLLWQQNVDRYLDFWWEKHDPRSIYLQVFSDLLPWTLPFVFAGVLAWRRGKTADGRFLALWFTMVFLFFFLGDSRRAAYLVPVYPAACLLAASLWVEGVREGRAGAPLLRSHFLLVLLSVSGSGLFLLYVLLQDVLPEAWAFPFAAAAPWILGLCAVFSTGAWVSMRLLRRDRVVAAFGAWAAALLLAQGILSLGFIPAMNPHKSKKKVIEQLVAPVPEGSILWCYRNERPWVIYYSPKPISGNLDHFEAVRDFLDRGYYFIMGQEDYERQGKALGYDPPVLAETPGKTKLYLVRK